MFVEQVPPLCASCPLTTQTEFYKSKDLTSPTHDASVTQCRVAPRVTYQSRTERFSLCFLVSDTFIYVNNVSGYFLTEVFHSNKTAYQMYWWPLGFHVLYEIAESQRPGCPPEFMNIPVPKDDPIFGHNSTEEVLLQFQRVQWDQSSGQSPNNPRKQVIPDVGLSVVNLD